MSDAFVTEVKSVAGGGEPTVALELLLGMERNDIKAKAAIRYLLNVGKWSFEEGSKFADALEHHFAKHDGMVSMEPQTYQKLTGDIIMELWGHEIVVVVPVSQPAAEKPAAKKPRSYKKNEDITLAKETASGSRTFKSLNEHNINTSGASDRLKKVINIQRNG